MKSSSAFSQEIGNKQQAAEEQKTFSYNLLLATLPVDCGFPNLDADEIFLILTSNS